MKALTKVSLCVLGLACPAHAKPSDEKKDKAKPGEVEVIDRGEKDKKNKEKPPIFEQIPKGRPEKPFAVSRCRLDGCSFGAVSCPPESGAAPACITAFMDRARTMLFVATLDFSTMKQAIDNGRKGRPKVRKQKSR